MTNQEAIDIFEDNFTVLNTHGHYTEDEETQAITKAISALTALEKIRGEIQKTLDRSVVIDTDNARAQFIALSWVLELFDKYTKGDTKC